MHKILKQSFERKCFCKLYVMCVLLLKVKNRNFLSKIEETKQLMPKCPPFQYCPSLILS